MTCYVVRVETPMGGGYLDESGTWADTMTGAKTFRTEEEAREFAEEPRFYPVLSFEVEEKKDECL